MDEYRRYGRRQLLASDRGSPPAKRLPVFSRPRSISPRFWLPLAASLVGGFLLLGPWGPGPEPGSVVQEGEVETNVPIVDLFPARTTRGRDHEAGREAVVNLSGGPSSFVLLVQGSDPDSLWSSYEIVIRTSDGRERWKSRELRQSEFGSFSLWFPSHFLEAGDYILTLYGVNSSEKEEIEEYRFSVWNE